MHFAESAAPPARPALPREPVGGAGAVPSGRAVLRGTERLLERIDAHFASDGVAVSALLVTPDGPTGELRPRAVWPPRAIPPAAVVQASVRASRTEGAVTASVDERRPQGATVVAARIETRDRMLGVVSVLVDGPPSDVARAIGRWLELFERLADDGSPGRPPACEGAGPPSPAGAPGRGEAARDAAQTAAARAADPVPHPAEPVAATAAPGVHRPAEPIAAPVDPLRGEPADDEPGDAIETAAVALRAVACHRALFGAERVEDGVRALLATLAHQHGCVRIACGWTAATRREGIVLSGAAEPRPPPSVRDAYAAAMDEALSRGAAVAWPEPRGRDAGLPVAQSRLAGARRVAAVCSVPLRGRGGVVGALTLEREGGTFDAATLDELERVAAFLAPALAVARRASRPFGAWLADLRRALPGARRPVRAPVRVGRASR